MLLIEERHENKRKEIFLEEKEENEKVSRENIESIRTAVKTS